MHGLRGSAALAIRTRKVALQVCPGDSIGSIHLIGKDKLTRLGIDPAVRASTFISRSEVSLDRNISLDETCEQGLAAVIPGAPSSNPNYSSPRKATVPLLLRPIIARLHTLPTSP